MSDVDDRVTALLADVGLEPDDLDADALDVLRARVADSLGRGDMNSMIRRAAGRSPTPAGTDMNALIRRAAGQPEEQP